LRFAREHSLGKREFELGLEKLIVTARDRTMHVECIRIHDEKFLVLVLLLMEPWRQAKPCWDRSADEMLEVAKS